MNKISKFASIALIGALATTTISAYDEPTWVGVPDANTYKGGKIFGSDANLTLTLATDWARGATFDLNIMNGTLPTGGTYLVCNGNTQVGEYLTVDTPANEGEVATITFQLINDNSTSEAGLLREDQNLTFVDGKSYNPASGGAWGADLTCETSKTMTIIPAFEKCATVNVNNGKSRSNGIAIPEMTSLTSGKVAEYREEVMISCTAPICKINTKRTHFIPGYMEEGVNLRGTTVEENATAYVGMNDDCYFQGCNPQEDILHAGASECNSTIVIKNNIRDINLTSANFAFTYTGSATGMGIDVNGTTATIGGTANVDISTILAGGGEGNVTVSLTGSDTGLILPGSLNASLTDINNLGLTLPEIYSHLPLIAPEQKLVSIEDTTPTHFTVQYMNPMFKSFVMVTAKGQDVRLNAVVTDTKGKTATAELGLIPAGQTKYFWADSAGHASSPLFVAANANGLDNGWHVDFKASASVDVAAYMDVNGGQRTLTVLYPEFTNGILHQKTTNYFDSTGAVTVGTLHQ